jgi:hypothetical protein
MIQNDCWLIFSATSICRIKKYFVASLLLLISSFSLAQTSHPASAATKVSSSARRATGNTYYLATEADGGSDTHHGLSPLAPWLTPNHPVECGDVILAAPSKNYSASNFLLNFGVVQCPGSGGVAWLKCATFDGCKITSGGTGMWVNQSHWGIQGWEITTTGGFFSPCFYASPSDAQSLTIHHIVFANDIANGCYGSGFAISNQDKVGVDYYAVVGSIIYDSVKGNTACFSGMNIAAPVPSDTLPGTHIYVGGVFSWNNFEPIRCNGGPPTDGEGIVIDTLDAVSYNQQVVIENNISFLNGSSGIRVGVSTKAQIHIQNNTVYGNNRDTHLGKGECGEIASQSSNNVNVSRNLIKANTAMGCGGSPNYALFVQAPYLGNVFDNNFAYSAAGNNVGQSGGFEFGAANKFGADPAFANPPIKNPGAPNCSRSASVSACMTPMIIGFTAKNPAAKGFGYQVPGSKSTYAPLFPKWLCSVNLPNGLVTLGCRIKP